MAEAQGTADPVGDLHGLVRFAGLATATPIAAIREVVPCPPTLIPFPAPRGDILGAIDLRGQIIPVLDLAATLSVAGGTPDGERPQDAARIIVIFRHEGHVFGAIAEAIEGVAALDGESHSPLRFEGAMEAPLIVGSFNLPVRPGALGLSPGEAISSRQGVVLDAAAIAALPGLPLAEDRVGATRHAGHARLPTLMFRIGGLGCGIVASCVDASVPWQELAPAPSEDPLWIAMLHYKGKQIPAIDTLQLLGHGALPAGRKSSAAIVVRTAPAEDDSLPGSPATERQGLVALLIDTVDDIARLADGDVNAFEQQGLPGSELVRGLIHIGGDPRLLLDETRLVNEPRLRLLGSIEQRPETGSGIGGTATPGSTRKDGGQGQRLPYLVFSLGDAPFSVPLDQVEEILTSGQDLVPLPDGGLGLMGLFAYREQAVPLIDLGAHLGLAGTTDMCEHRFVIVTRDDCPGAIRRTAFMVDSLRSVDRVALQRIGGEGERPSGLPTATIRLGDGQACSVLDLNGIAARLQPA